MTIIYPENRKEVSDRISTDVQNELPEINPSLRNSIFRSLIIGMAGRLFDIYEQQRAAQVELFPDTATEITFIRRWGLFKGLDVNASSQSLGPITATGTIGSIIPEGATFQTVDNLEYTAVNQDYTIQFVLLTCGITRVLNLATAQFSVSHNFASGMTVTFAGADQTEYNGDKVIIVVDNVTVTYQVTGNPATPATGALTGSADLARVTIQSVDTGIIQNLDSGTKVSLKNPISGVDTDAFVQHDGIIGGTDEETAVEYRTRVLDKYANPISNFNDSDIEFTLKKINGITKVWTFDASPIPGKIRTYFIRGNDANIFPDANEVDAAKNEMLKIKTAPMQDEDVIVSSPTPVTVDFVFTALTPNSQSMQAAIKESLKQMFIDDTEVEINLSQDQYRSVIQNTLNPSTGEQVTSFALSQPVGAIAINEGELAAKGNITFNIT